MLFCSDLFKLNDLFAQLFRLILRRDLLGQVVQVEVVYVCDSLQEVAYELVVGLDAELEVLLHVSYLVDQKGQVSLIQRIINGAEKRAEFYSSKSLL
jgi:hypothetical protein